MKKQFIKVKDFANLAKIKKQINDTLTGEKSAELKEALTSLISELDASEVEVDEVAFAEQVAELIKKYLSDPEAEVPAAVADAIAKKIKAVQDSIQRTGGDKISQKVKNEIAKAIFTAKKDDRKAIEDSVKKILVENGVAGLEFAEAVDYSIATKWEDLNPLLAKLKRTFMSKFFYSTDAMNAVAVIAKQWDKTSEAGVKKTIQAITTTPKEISTAYAYTRQQMNQEDLDDIAEVGQESTFLSWINNELDLHLANTIVMAILVGDAINEAGKKITKFETIGTKNATDAFTFVAGPATANAPTVSDVRKMCDTIHNPNGLPKVLCIAQSLLTDLSAYTYAAGGDVHYRTREEMAGQFGVNELYVTDVLSNVDGLHAICMIPQGYWYKEKKSLNVSWQDYAENRLNYMKEKNVGGAIHDLLSTAILKEGGTILVTVPEVG
ncbi:MAG: hypothetical protein RBT65_16090 [Methanolobus sp.]|nr:hypothetical protein [Methanolobus sp.]